jgi:hypothetical protein|tara:strand:- start:359 stop:649 length:291 start_codon:yes stop_codon:yes gene_type:complete
MREIEIELRLLLVKVKQDLKLNPMDREAQVRQAEELLQLCSNENKLGLNLLNLLFDLIRGNDPSLQDLKQDRLRLSEIKAQSRRLELLLSNEAVLE